MLTLVAAVVVYDLALDPVVDLREGLEVRDDWSLGLLSRNARSETKEEKDIMLVTLLTQRSDKCMKFSAQDYLSMLTEAGGAGCSV